MPYWDEKIVKPFDDDTHPSSHYFNRSISANVPVRYCQINPYFRHLWKYFWDTPGPYHEQDTFHQGWGYLDNAGPWTLASAHYTRSEVRFAVYCAAFKASGQQLWSDKKTALLKRRQERQ